MKKSLLNIAISVAIISASALATQTYAIEYIPVDNDNSNSKTTETYMLPGMGAGAATGAVMAGPVGLLIGGIIGAVVGSSQEIDGQVDSTPVDDVISSISPESNKNLLDNFADTADMKETGKTKNNIQLAKIGPINTIADEQIDPSQEDLMNILVTDLSLDVYFRSGSTDIEKFYPARLTAIADLINSMDKLELHLDGYTDRHGNKSQNIALADERVEKVRQQLINAGVEDNRIISKSFGEMKMVSDVGDLDAYTFDRKVVIRFERANPNSINSMTTALSEAEIEQTTTSSSEINLNPVVADVSNQF